MSVLVLVYYSIIGWGVVVFYEPENNTKNFEYLLEIVSYEKNLEIFELRLCCLCLIWNNLTPNHSETVLSETNYSHGRNDPRRSIEGAHGCVMEWRHPIVSHLLAPQVDCGGVKSFRRRRFLWSSENSFPASIKRNQIFRNVGLNFIL